MICNHLDHVGNHLQSSAMSAADVADFWGISDVEDNVYRSRTHGMMHPRTGAHSIFDTQRQQDTAVACSC